MRTGRQIPNTTPLARAIRTRSLNVTKVAAAVDVSERMLRYYIHGEYPIPGRVLIKLSDYLDLDPEDIIYQGNHR